MKQFLERASVWLPYVLALVVPLAGLIYGLVQISDGQRDAGIRIVLLSLFAGVIWIAAFTA